MARQILLGWAVMTIVALITVAPSGGPHGSAVAPVVVRVPQDVPSIDRAIDGSGPGTMILVDRGTYPGRVYVGADRDDITIRGVDRNAVVLDGGNEQEDGIEIHADGVAVENLTIRNFTGNGLYWTKVRGFAARYVTVANVGLYGIYAIESTDGVFEDSLVSGAADAAFYIGECNPCHTTLHDLIARYSAIGYSGTNAGGDLEISDSLWESNGSGIMPNSYEGQEAPPPQRSSTIVRNTVRDSGTVPVPANSPLAGYLGVGIAVAGGWDNTIAENVVTGSQSYGIALYPSVQRDEGLIHPSGNTVRDNEVSGSGKADLAIAQGSADGNCFSGNEFGSSLPADLERLLGCGDPPATLGDATVLADLGVPVPVALERLGPRPAYSEMPLPPAQPVMPSTAPADPAPAGRASEPAAAVLVAVSAIVLVLVALGFRRRSSPRR